MWLGERCAFPGLRIEIRGTRLVVYADDRSYEKKDRNVNEPLQFYSGKAPALYEIVVNSIGNKNQISGYLATPKNAN